MTRPAQIIRRGKTIALTRDEVRGTLLDWLRVHDGATGTKEGCAEGDCGACTVVLERRRDGRLVRDAVNSCILFAGQADGANITTVEDLASGSGELHPVQAAMMKHHGAQCGFCTPGIVMSLYALHETAVRPVTRDMICDQLAGNLCRCTGYRPIIDAALEACGSASTRQAPPPPTLPDADDIFIGDDDDFFAAPSNEKSFADLYLRHPDARLVAGATDAGLLLTKSLDQPRKVIWLGRVTDLDTIEQTRTHLVLGATVTHTQAMPHLAAIDPDFGEIMRRFGSVQVRNSGTVGGNIANGSPIGDLAPGLIALSATLELAHGETRRQIALEDFFIAYKQQDRRPSEYVRRVMIPLLATTTHFRAFKISKRLDEDISSVLGAFAIETNDRRVTSARIAYGGLAGTPSRARETEHAIAGAALDDATTWQPAIDALAVDFSPLDDHRASAAYRGLVAGSLLRKALIEIGGTSSETTRLTRPREARHAAA